MLNKLGFIQQRWQKNFFSKLNSHINLLVKGRVAQILAGEILKAPRTHDKAYMAPWLEAPDQVKTRGDIECSLVSNKNICM